MYEVQNSCFCRARMLSQYYSALCVKHVVSALFGFGRLTTLYCWTPLCGISTVLSFEGRRNLTIK